MGAYVVAALVLNLVSLALMPDGPSWRRVGAVIAAQQAGIAISYLVRAL